MLLMVGTTMGALEEAVEAIATASRLNQQWGWHFRC